jgi:hypothetical protein
MRVSLRKLTKLMTLISWSTTFGFELLPCLLFIRTLKAEKGNEVMSSSRQTAHSSSEAFQFYEYMSEVPPEVEEKCQENIGRISVEATPL